MKRNPDNYCPSCGRRKSKKVKLCRWCTTKKVRSKEGYNKYMNAYMLDRYKRRREGYLRKLGNKCGNCGSIYDLEFDHIDPETKEFNIAKLLAGFSDDAILKELEKCQLLCHDCHKEKNKIDNKHSRKCKKNRRLKEKYISASIA